MMTPLPLGIAVALSLTCGALPLLAQGTYCLLYTSDAADD